MTTMTALRVQSRPPRRRRSSRHGNHLFAYVIAFLLAATVIVPILYVVLGGFRTTAQLNSSPVALPSPWVLENYTFVLTSGAFWRQVFNSTIVACMVTAVAVALGSAAA